MNRAGKVTGGAFPEWYVKKPIPVEAIMATMENREECEKFCPDFKCANSKTPSIVGTIKTLEGAMMVENGSYIVKGVKGEFWAVRGDIFEETYAPLGLRGGE